MHESEFQDAISAASDVEFRVEAADRRRFNALMKSHHVGRLSLSEVECDPAIIERPGQNCNGSKAFVVVQIDGSGTIHYGEKKFSVAPGDFFIADSAHSYQNIFSTRVRRVVIRMDRDYLLARAPGASRLYGTRVAGNSGTARLFSSLLQTLLTELPEIDPRAHDLLGTRLVDMFALTMPLECMVSYPLSREDGDSLRRRALRQRILDHINLNLADPDLNTRKIADVIRVSPRYIQDLFAGTGITVRDYIRDQRLQRCHDTLRDRRQSHLTISQIAFDAGFNSLEHFCRCFLAKYGTSASSLRQSQAGIDYGENWLGYAGPLG